MVAIWRGVRMRGGTRHFSFLQNVQNGCESLSFLFNGYQNSLPVVKRLGHELSRCPRLRMSGDLPLLPQYAFMSWTSTGLPSFIFSVSEIKLSAIWSVAVDGVRPLASYHGLLIPREEPSLLTEQQGLLDSPLCRKCGVKEETSTHILCECEALAALRCRYLGSFFLEPEDIKILSLGAIWSFRKAAGLPWYDMGHKGPVCKA
jgi:hypothetical protein